MKVNSGIKLFLFFPVIVVYVGCGSTGISNANTSDTVVDNAAVAIKEDPSLRNSNDSLERNKQIKLYVQAITAYIKAVYRKDKSNYDTLFFGKHLDFPDIKLPKKVLNTEIILLSSEEADERRIHNPSMIYINLFGEITAANAQFIFVTFFPGYQHQYDYFFDFELAEKSSDYVLNKIQFEDYANRKSDKPERVVLFKNGKYVD